MRKKTFSKKAPLLFLVVIFLLAVTAIYIFHGAKTFDVNKIILLPNISERQETKDLLEAFRSLMEQADALRMPNTVFDADYSEAKNLFDQGKYAEAKHKIEDSSKYINTVIAQENVKPKIAITFDAGAGAEPIQDLINYLHDSRVKITFFSTGKWAETNSALLKEILDPRENTKNQLGNHTYDHPHFILDNLADEQITSELVKTESIFRAKGYEAKPLFRYPYGERNRHTDEIVKSLGYKPTPWTLDSLGWQGTHSSYEIVSRVVDKIGPNGIVLMHVGSKEDVAALPQIIDKLKDLYRFVFVSEL
ncbi:MAG: hypothetical protein A3A80_04530 [Candidatus Terrybacteria bacterium RIFCSPLOWO2_01_FULL_44_24]|nr:MAG: hypothetical protein A3B75_01185 [Candidatus Terrybacteria bacterium RIFCSPHIGHO2_02_FULL_43_14]OHA51351.1 MAG: hypothetical protein A3A80_04530 [Candidatus Terrybacteria bacterium RIFCSPLOWO2_01_FULL_44_24]